MSKPVRFTIREDGERYVVNVPAKHSETGKRQRLYFETLTLAEAEQKRRLGAKAHFGTSVSTLSADVSADAQRALATLERFDGVTLTAAAKFYSDAMDERAKSMEFGALIDEFVASLERRNMSASYIRDAKYVKTRLEPFLGGRVVCDITLLNLRDAFVMAKLTATGQKSLKRNLRAAFTYAVAHGYSARNPAKGLITDDSGEREIAILTPSETQALYDAADEELKPYVIFATWCGIRPEEAKRLDWGDVSWEREWVEVRRATSKTKRRRFVAMAENVLAMLEPFRGRTGKVVAISQNAWRLKFEAARKKAGVFDGWQEDTLRHSFASYHCALHNDLDGLARQMGHSGTGTAYQHYLDAVGLKEAKEFWAVGLPEPKAKKKSKVPTAA